MDGYFERHCIDRRARGGVGEPRVPLGRRQHGPTATLNTGAGRKKNQLFLASLLTTLRLSLFLKSLQLIFNTNNSVLRKRTFLLWCWKRLPLIKKRLRQPLIVCRENKEDTIS